MAVLQEAASEVGAVAVEAVEGSADAATLALAVSRVVVVAVGVGEVVASAGEVEEDGKAVRQSLGIISEFSICRWDIQNHPRLGRFSAFRKRKGASLLSKRFVQTAELFSCDKVRSGLLA